MFEYRSGCNVTARLSGLKTNPLDPDTGGTDRRHRGRYLRANPLDPSCMTSALLMP